MKRHRSAWKEFLQPQDRRAEHTLFYAIARTAEAPHLNDLLADAVWVLEFGFKYAPERFSGRGPTNPAKGIAKAIDVRSVFCTDGLTQSGGQRVEDVISAGDRIKEQERDYRLRLASKKQETGSSSNQDGQHYT